MKFVCRYLSTIGNPKNLVPAEAALVQSSGLSLVTVFETTADRALAGGDAGRYDASSASFEALSAGGLRAPIYFAVDFDVTRAQLPRVREYFAGARQILRGRLGVYGGYRVVNDLFDRKLVDYGWQTYAWSGGRWDRRAHIRQYSNGHVVGGVSCDFDAAMKTNFGQWGRKPLVPKRVPKYAVHILDEHGHPAKAFTCRRPALVLAKWGIANHHPKRIEIQRLG